MTCPHESSHEQPTAAAGGPASQPLASDQPPVAPDVVPASLAAPEQARHSAPRGTTGQAAAPQPQVDRRFFVRIGLNTLGLIVVGGVLLLALGFLQRIGWLTAGGPAADSAAAEEGVIWTCPMHPQIRQPNPGRCPICAMPLERAATGSAAALDELAVRIEPAARRLANIQTALVESRPVTRAVEAVGRLSFDESRQATISAYVGGRIERLFADYTGVEVPAGGPLVILYSPELYAAQVEFLESIRSAQALDRTALPGVQRAQERLVAISRQRLAELGMTERQLRELETSRQAQTRLTIYAPIGGTVVEKLAVEGRYVERGEPIYQIADLSTIWLLVQLYPEDAAQVRFGQKVVAEVHSLPGREFTGRVAFVAPMVDQRTRTVDVRVEMPNPQRLLRPGDYAQATIEVPLGEQGEIYDAELAGKWISPMHPQIVRDQPGTCPICGMDLVPTGQYGYADTPTAQPEVLVVPRRAVLMTGTTSLVYVETEPGRFEIRPIRLGPLLGNEAVVISGVQAGEAVAVSGNFLIDSQMQLAGKPSLIDPTRAVARPPGHNAPLPLPTTAVEAISGAAGEALERLYASYSAVAAALATDRLPTEAETKAVAQAAADVLASQGLDEALRPHVEAVGQEVEHLHHLELKSAREKFKSISRHMLHLAAAVRGQGATQPLVHLWCSMVPGGEGDWLQTSLPPANPYWGAAMRRCAQHQQPLPLPQTSAEPESPSPPRAEAELKARDSVKPDSNPRSPP
jgi:Cu(I)/Ag(I) efflux system membrane fusion protein